MRLLLRLWAPALLFLLALVAFWPLVLHPDQTLYSDTSDLLAQHLPAKLFLVRSLHETGELPLWNPDQYAGSPFVHDIQVGLFYPPNLPLYVLPESAVGPFLSWLVFAHVVLAGWLMYAYARHAGFGELSAFAAGAGYMLAPRWMMQLFLAGHTVTVGIAWLPLVLLCVERAILRRSWPWAVGGGVAYALLVLGTHPQWTFYGSLLIGLWPLRLLGVSRRFMVRWLMVGAAVVLAGLSLCAVQLLPTMEAAGESSRARGIAQSWSLDGARAALPTLIGPFPERTPEGVHWEARGGIGFLWAVLALAGVARGGRAARVPVLIALGMLVYALGGSLLVDRLPGFSTFRMPTRMLLTSAFPVAYLAGLGVQTLVREWSGPALRGATVVVTIVVLGPGLLAVLSGAFPRLAAVNPGWRAYWLAVPAAWMAFLVVAPRQAARPRALVLVALLVGDLVGFSIRFPDTRRTEDIYPPSPLLEPIRQDEQLRGALVYDPAVNDQTTDCFLGPGSPVASVYGVRSVRGYNPLDVARYRQFLAFVADVGEPQRAFSGNFTNPVMRDFPVKNRRLFDLLGVAWAVAPADDPPAGGGWVGVAGTVDPAPRSYNFLGGGMRELPPMRLYFNTRSMPRAFVVPAAVPDAGEAGALAQLKKLDPWQTATLTDWDPAADPLPPGGAGRRWQPVVDARPNSLTVQLDGQSAGLLVVTDPWYPGWKCWVDGTEVPVRRADYAFRGVMVPKGARGVEFRFEPWSYKWGKLISLFTLATTLLVLGVAGAYRRLRR